MKRVLPFVFFAGFAAIAYACSSDSGDDPTNTSDGGPNNGEGGGGDTDGGGGETDGDTPDSPNVPTGNPIEGVGTPRLITDPVNYQGFADGPQWRGDSLYFSDVTNMPSVVWKFTPPNTFVVARNVTAGSVAQGGTYDEKNNTFVTAEAVSGTPGGQLTRWQSDGGLGTPVTPTFDGGSWLSPNDLVVRKSDGVTYVTDPAYQAGSDVVNNVYRILPNGNADSIDAYGNGERPNGIALNAAGNTLYVSFTEGSTGTGYIQKYTLAADGSVTAKAKFADIPAPEENADGMAIDEGGNLYVAVKAGVLVFKADGSGRWGKIATPKEATNVGFGGADRKTLYITANGGVYEVTGLKIAGIAQ